MSAEKTSFAYGTARVVAYLIALVAAFQTAFTLGASRYENAYCTDPDGADCDPALGAGALWALAAMSVALVVIIAIEVPLYLGRRRRRMQGRDGA